MVTRAVQEAGITVNINTILTIMEVVYHLVSYVMLNQVVEVLQDVRTIQVVEQLDMDQHASIVQHHGPTIDHQAVHMPMLKLQTAPLLLNINVNKFQREELLSSSSTGVY